MPNKISPQLVKASISKGYLELSNGGLKISESAPKQLKDLITDDLSQGAAGDEKEFIKAPLYLDPDLGGASDESGVMQYLRHEMALDEITKAWNRSGGFGSPVGLPLERSISITEDRTNHWVARFRSGDIVMHVNPNGSAPEINAVVRHQMSIRLTGIECQVRQEKGFNDVYGTAGIVTPADNKIETVPVPRDTLYFRMSDTKALGRLGNVDIPLIWKRPVQDVQIVVNLFESDADAMVDAIKRRAAEKLQQLGREWIAGKTGYDAEDWFGRKAQQDVVYEGMGLIGKALGMADDAFSRGSLHVSADEILAGPQRQQPFQRKDDSSVIADWTHSVTVEGRDFGNDLGRYQLFFDVTRVDTNDAVQI